MERKKITFDSFIRGSIGCVLVIGILMLIERLSGVLLPFFIAWLIAYMIYPLVKLFQYKLRLYRRCQIRHCSSGNKCKGNDCGNIKSFLLGMSKFRNQRIIWCTVRSNGKIVRQNHNQQKHSIDPAVFINR